MRKLNGIHHVTAITSSAEKNYDFFTNILGMRLVKKTVNQDDIQTYHLFFADDRGNAGTDMTFFDFKGIAPAVHGTNEIARSSFRVPNDEALNYFIKRFDHYNIRQEEVKTLFNRKVLFFYDFDNQPYALFSDQDDQGVKPGEPWHKGPVPDEYAIYGLGPIFLAANNLNNMKTVLVDILGMRHIDKDYEYHLFEMGDGGNGGSVIVIDDKRPVISRQGFGGVHHVAFRVDDQDMLHQWYKKLLEIGAPNSGFVDRFYFRSLYTRLYPGILFEFATEGPGFIDDEEDYEILGETLALPPKFRNRKEEISKYVRHIDTVRSNKVFKKEYFD